MRRRVRSGSLLLYSRGVVYHTTCSMSNFFHIDKTGFIWYYKASSKRCKVKIDKGDVAMLKEKLYSFVKNKKLFAAVIVGIVLLIAMILALVLHFTQTPGQITNSTTKAPDIQVSPTPTSVLTPTFTEAPTPAATSTPMSTPEITVPPTEKPTERPAPVATAKPTPKPTAPPTKEPTATMQIIYARVLHLTVPSSAHPGETIRMPADPNMDGAYTIIISCPGCEEISETYSFSIASNLSIQWTVPLEAQPGTATIRTVTDTSEEVYHITITELTE